MGAKFKQQSVIYPSKECHSFAQITCKSVIHLHEIILFPGLMCTIITAFITSFHMQIPLINTQSLHDINFISRVHGHSIHALEVNIHVHIKHRK